MMESGHSGQGSESDCFWCLLCCHFQRNEISKYQMKISSEISVEVVEVPVTSNVPSQALVSLEVDFHQGTALMLFDPIFPTVLSFCKSVFFMTNQQLLCLFYSN